MKKTVTKGRIVSIEKDGKVKYAFKAKKKLVIESPDQITDYADNKAPDTVKRKLK